MIAGSVVGHCVFGSTWAPTAVVAGRPWPELCRPLGSNARGCVGLCVLSLVIRLGFEALKIAGPAVGLCVLAACGLEQPGRPEPSVSPSSARAPVGVIGFCVPAACTSADWA